MLLLTDMLSVPDASSVVVLHISERSVVFYIVEMHPYVRVVMLAVPLKYIGTQMLASPCGDRAGSIVPEALMNTACCCSEGCWSPALGFGPASLSQLLMK